MELQQKSVRDRQRPETIKEKIRIVMRFCEFICRLIIYFCYLTYNYKMTDYARTTNELRTTIMSIQNHHHDKSKLRFISPEKWKNLMLKSLEVVSEFNYADKDLIHDLRLIIANISQDKFIQAILSFQPFKPKFRSVKFLDLDCHSSRMASTATNSQCCFQTPKTKLKKDQSIIEKGSIIISKKNSCKKEPRTCETIKQIYQHQKQSFLKEYLEVIIQQETLKKEFQKKYHPFKKIIQSFAFILQNKFKNLIDEAPHIHLQKIQELITYDILVLEKLFSKISEPYQTIYQSENPEEVKCFRNKMVRFVQEYVRYHQKIGSALRKVMRHFAKKSKTLKQISKSVDDFAQVDKFNIPDDFKIDGCYVQSMTALMEFSETFSADQSLQKLKQFRSSIAKDVDHFYQSAGQLKQRQINAQVQIEIVRFVLCKLKSWIPDIYAQLKFLEIVYGDQEIAYKYDDASYIYAQLITVFDALQIESSSFISKRQSENAFQ